MLDLFHNEFDILDIQDLVDVFPIWFDILDIYGLELDFTVSSILFNYYCVAFVCKMGYLQVFVNWGTYLHVFGKWDIIIIIKTSSTCPSELTLYNIHNAAT